RAGADDGRCRAAGNWPGRRGGRVRWWPGRRDRRHLPLNAPSLLARFRRHTLARPQETAPMTTSLEQALQAALAPRDLLTHPFYQAWSAGELRAEDLARYAEQYRFQVAALPELLRRARSLTHDADTEADLSRNLDDEEGRSGVAHARLWEAFGTAAGAAAGACPPAQTPAPPGQPSCP